MKDPTDVFATEAVRESQERSRRRRQEMWRATLRRSMSSEAGREIVAALIEYCGLSQLSYAPDSERQTCFNEGRRSVGQWLAEEIQTNCGEQWHVMQREHMERAAALRLAEEREVE